MSQQMRNILFATTLAIVTAAATTHAGPCKNPGAECATTASCCRGLLCVNSNPPGKRPKGICLSPTTTSTTTTSSTTSTVTTTTMPCVPDHSTCNVCGPTTDNCGQQFFCAVGCDCEMHCVNGDVFGFQGDDCQDCSMECFFQCGGECDHVLFDGVPCDPN